MIYKLKLFLKLILKNPYRAFLVYKPRYQAFTFVLFGKKIRVPDAASFLFMYQEIFERQIYNFQTTTNQPVIIDGGANIGLSILFCKQLYPHAKIIGFEPDNRIFEILEHNMQQFDFQDIILHQKALWKTETRLKFQSEGADAGRIDTEKQDNYIQVEAVSLRNYLNQPIDFLKLDIEGAETEVLESCQDLLKNVKNIFVEYHSFYPQTQTLQRILEILVQNGFRYYLENNGVQSQNPFQTIRTEAGMDLQLNIFGYRID